jgi:hypothetical protein
MTNLTEVYDDPATAQGIAFANHLHEEHEQILLGTLLTHPPDLQHVVALVSPDDFVEADHRTIYRAIQAQAQTDEPVLPETVQNRLQSTERELITQLLLTEGYINGLMRSDLALHYARQVHCAALDRQIDWLLMKGRQSEAAQLILKRDQVRNVGSAPRLISHTGSEIAATVPAATDWIVKPWIAAGAITELDGKIKVAGKTTLATFLARAVLDGLPFLGQPTRSMPVVYLTEQTPASFRQTMRRAGLEHADLHVVYWHENRSLRWPELVQQAAALAGSVGSRLLIVDTLSQMAGLRGDSENSTGAAQEAMEPLQEVAATAGLGIFVLRHERKSGGDVGDSGRGSSAFGGAVDLILSLRRPEGNTRPTLRELHAVGRFDETPDKIVIELTDQGYISQGNVGAVAARETRAAVLHALQGGELTDVEISDVTGKPRTSVRHALDELQAENAIGRVGAGKKGDPYRYTAILSDQSIQNTLVTNLFSVPLPEEKVSDQTSRGFGQKESPTLEPGSRILSDQTSLSNGHKPNGQQPEALAATCWACTGPLVDGHCPACETTRTA